MSPITCPKCKSADHVFITRHERFAYPDPPVIVWVCRDAACDPAPFTDFSPEAIAQAEKFAARQAQLKESFQRLPDRLSVHETNLFDKEGRPISMNDWIRLGEDFGYKVVARSNLPGGGFVSTVWLGLNQRFREEPPPLIFESMVFDTGDEERDGDQDRYETLEQAKAGHWEMFKRHGGVQ